VKTSRLEVGREEVQRSEGLDDGGLGLQGGHRLRARRQALAHDLLTALVRFRLQGVVLLHAGEEVLVTAGAADVLDAHVDALAHLAVADHLGHFHTDGGAADVEDDARAAVVVRERHTAGLGRVDLDVDVVTALERGQVRGQRSDTFGLEGLGEFVASASALTERVRHFEVWFLPLGLDR